MAITQSIDLQVRTANHVFRVSNRNKIKIIYRGISIYCPSIVIKKDDIRQINSSFFSFSVKLLEKVICMGSTQTNKSYASSAFAFSKTAFPGG